MLKTKTFGPFKFYIDRPKGTVKKWPNKTFTYPVDYGYFKKTKAEDGEGLDCFVGDHKHGHFESFMKLFEDGTPDEMKFIIGVDDKEREIIYNLYKGEVNSRKVYGSLVEMMEDVNKYVPNKKDRYSIIKQAMMDAYSDYNLMPAQADISTKINRGFERIDTKMAPGASEMYDGTLFQQDVM